MDVRRRERDLTSLDLKLAAREDRTAVALLLLETGKGRFLDETCKNTIFDGKLQRPVHTLKYGEVCDLHRAQGETYRTRADLGEPVRALRVNRDLLGGQLACELREILSGENGGAGSVDLGGNGDDKAQLIVCGLEFELSFSGVHIDTGENRGLRLGREPFADDLQRGDQVALGQGDVHDESFRFLCGVGFSIAT